ncbi:hypothetical protein BDW22DRAFT_1349966 [Trametopsis cervina]|nr:hypothetical protein BDW22DRAFT_1349966 [Trametopsis cervina]
MLFSLAIPFSLLIVLVNGAALPQKREADLNARDFLSDLGDIVQGIAQAIPADVLDSIESLVGSIVDPTDLAAVASPATTTAVPQIPGSPLGAAPTPAFAIPGTPLDQLVGSATTAPARRSRLNSRNADVEKRIDLDGIVGSGAAESTSVDAPPAASPSPFTPEGALRSGSSHAHPAPSRNAARSLSGSSFTLTGSAIVLASAIFGAVVAL